MTVTYKDLPVLENSFAFAHANSLTQDSDKMSATTQGHKRMVASKVVKLKDLENYLKNNIPENLQEVLARYDSLRQFLTDKHDYNFFDGDFGDRWSCEIMTVNKYQRKLKESRQFLPLKKYIAYNEYVFVVYHNPKTYSNITRNLTTSVYKSIEEYYLPESQYDIYRDIRNRVNAMIEDVFSEVWATAELIGAVKKELAIEESRAVMVIRIHSSSFKDGAKFMDPKNWETSPCNLEYISKLLTKIGMVNIETIVETNRCKFYDPVTKINCRISADLGLVYERDEMILEYFKLDKRIKPLVAAVTQYVDTNCLQRGDHFQFLGKTSYTIMVLYFLMCGLKNPVIVSLQNPPFECKSTTCRFNKSNGRLLTKFKDEIQEHYIKYHDCIRIINSVTGECNSVGGISKDSESTVWVSKNNDDLGSLLIGFFKFYSSNKNYRTISIINNDGKIVGVEYDNYKRASVFIQDPYIIRKNISSDCISAKRKIIIDSFTSAKNSLREEASFEKICQM